MSNTFVQVPPQSTGKKIATVGLTELHFDNLVGAFENVNVVVGAISGASGTVTGQINYDATAGNLFLKNVTGTFQDNEPLQVNAVTVATSNVVAATPQTDFDIQKMAISDPDNPDYMQKIDRFGATVNTFTDGSPVFGSFGTLTVGQPQINRVYRFATGLEEDTWSTVTNGAGNAAWEGNRTSILMSTSSASGDLVQRTTNYYHPYIPGVGINIECTVQIGDAGKDGCRRRWGYFDDEDGFFFELDGTDFYVVKRTSTSGTPVDIRIAQQDFNRDQVDGTDSLGLTLDVTKGNMYWFDIQWYGSGRVRYGMYEPGGTRLTMHEFEHANIEADYPYTRTATLPMRFEQENTSITAGTSQMRNTGTLIKNAYRSEVTGTKRTGNSGVKTVTLGNEIPLVGFRTKQLYNGYTNRGVFKGISTSLTNLTTDGVVIFRLRGCTDVALTGEAFTSVDDGSITEIDVTASAVNTALTAEIASFIVSTNNTLFAQDNADRTLPTFETHLKADGLTQPIILLTAECISGVSADVIGAVNWEELKW